MSNLIRTLRLFLFLLILVPGISYSQDWSWVKGFGGTNNDFGQSIITDAQGNIYLTGEFYTSLTFSPLAAVNSAGNVDYFIAKLDSARNGLWVRKGGSTLTDRGFGTALDNNGNIITCGVYFYTSAFQGGNNPTAYLGWKGNNLDAFVAKYDTDGNLTWIKKVQTNPQDGLKSVAVDKDNNIIAIGFAGIDTVYIDSTNVIYGNGGRDALVVKFDQNGNYLWAKSFGSANSGEEGKSVVVDDNNNIYITGFTTGRAKFGSVTLDSLGGEDVFVAKLSSDGSVIWAKNFGGKKNDESYGIQLDASGNICIAGNYDSAAVFGTNNLTSAGVSDAFIAKLDPNGNVIWIKSGGGTDTELGYSLAKDKSDNLYITGNFKSAAAAFDSLQISTAGAEDVYVAKYNSNGVIQWLKRGGGTGTDRGYCVRTDAGDNVLLTGYYSAIGTFGSIVLPAALTADLFIARIGDNSLPVELTSFTAEAVTGKVTLRWSTATEINNKGFEVQRSADNKNFAVIGFVTGRGTTSEKQNYTFTDKVTGKYYYRISQVDFDGTSTFSNTVEANNVNPDNFALMQNYPNPFNPETNISYNLASDARVKLELYDVNGELISTLVNNEQSSGFYSYNLNASSVKSLASGVYFYRMTAVNKTDGKIFSDVKKLMYMK